VSVGNAESAHRVHGKQMPGHCPKMMAEQHRLTWLIKGGEEKMGADEQLSSSGASQLGAAGENSHKWEYPTAGRSKKLGYVPLRKS